MPSPFPERPPSGRSAVPIPLSAQQSNVSSRVRLAAAVAEMGRYPSYGQPQVGHGSHALLERVAALDNPRARSLPPALQEKLRGVRAQVAMAA
ncbi:hypothetical protein F444_22423 [Phytophthora nicotianae P1976]|uniref:Uncharacterized protein n=1 Tax=Phytophthora nicotianae P1976 TaxID=1317066 RepID=A0A080YXU5_PHYNI|nr:hypothetical protein F444_22423 [Phytophthora nicotianae P1976]